MYNGIQHFVKYGIPQLEENQRTFMEPPPFWENAKKEEGQEKQQVKYLHVEADEDHIALQFHKKKGDIKRWKWRRRP